MSEAQIIDGKAFGAKIRESVAREVSILKGTYNLTPTLAVVLVGEDPASQVYVRNKIKQTKECGMRSLEHILSGAATEETVLELVRNLNNDPNVNGILVQLPLPKTMNSKLILAEIDPKKDVDGFHVSNVGKLWLGEEAIVPCTPLGCMLLLKDFLGDLDGKRALILGRSNIVGKPMAALLLAENCTVTIAHSKTREIEKRCREADILIAAVGQAEIVGRDWVKPGAVVIDVGINRINTIDDGIKKTKIVGDVKYSDVAQIASAITPVPGGVGPMTIACLLRNTCVATFRQQGIEPPKF